METHDEYASFMLRLWRVSSPDSPAEEGWQSEIQHIQSGQRWTFGTVEGLLDFLRQQTMQISATEGENHHACIHWADAHRARSSSAPEDGCSQSPS